MGEVELAKKLNDMYRSAKGCSIGSSCLLCGKEIDSPIHSHSLPQFVLRRISNGKRLHSTMILSSKEHCGVAASKLNEFGVQNAGIFRFLCKQCDKDVFSTYENPELWKNVSDQGISCLDDKVLAEVFLKSTLLNKWKNLVTSNVSLEPYGRLGDKNQYCDLYQRDCDVDIAKLKGIIKNENTNMFEFIYFDVLDHCSDFASQALLTIRENVDGSLINDIANQDPSYRIAHLQTLLLPVEKKTLCLAYCLKEDFCRYSSLKRYFDSLKVTAKRKLFQSILMLYSEDVYTNEAGIRAIEGDKKTIEFIRNLDSLISQKSLSGFRRCKLLF